MFIFTFYHKWDIIYTVLQLVFFNYILDLFPITTYRFTSFFLQAIENSTCHFFIYLVNVHHYSFHLYFYTILNKATMHILVSITASFVWITFGRKIARNITAGSQCILLIDTAQFSFKLHQFMLPSTAMLFPHSFFLISNSHV